MENMHTVVVARLRALPSDLHLGCKGISDENMRWKRNGWTLGELVEDGQGEPGDVPPDGGAEPLQGLVDVGQGGDVAVI